ncbi:MAG: ShlB/FhaC/HecB family hemolysin secretion/activation protein [Pseudomonadota bacterium]
MLLKLSPDTVRLRRKANALAAGECSREEYRLLRREVIDACARPVRRDDTQRRGVVDAQDDTQRSVAPSLQDREPGPVLLSVAGRRRRGPLEVSVLAVCLLGLAALIVTLWPQLLLAADASQSTPAVDLPARFEQQIPAVRDRAADPANSRRLTISQLSLTTDDDLPRRIRDIAVQTLDAGLANARASQAPDETGFTAQELKQLGQLLSAFGVHEPNGEISRSEADVLNDTIQRLKAERGVSVQQLELIAQDVQTAVRSAGLPLAVAYVPAQTVEDGDVSIGLLPGRLGAVAVSGARQSKTEQLVALQLKDLRGSIVTEGAFETRLGRLSQVPGLETQVRVQPGRVPGSADLNVELLADDLLSFGVRADNEGFEGVGSERLNTWLGVRNALGLGEQLLVGAGFQFGDGDRDQLWIDYQQPWARAGVRLGLAASRSEFSVDDPFADLGAAVGGLAGTVDGTSKRYELSAERLLHETRPRRTAVSLAIGRHDFSYSGFDDQNLTFVDVRLDRRRRFDRLRLAFDARLGFEYGRLDEALRLGQKQDSYRLHTRGRLWHAPAANGRLLKADDKLLLRWRGQWSSDDLAPSRTLVIGEAGFGRGFDPFQLLADRGFSAAAEWRRPQRLGEGYLFVDSAYGNGANNRDSGFAWLLSAGVGWDVRWTDAFSSRLSLGVPLASNGSPDPDDDGVRLYWRLDYAP